jgi:hypothetical protein
MKRRIFDQRPGLALDTIAPLSERAQSLLARAHLASGIQAHALALCGTVVMLRGLDYHHARMVQLSLAHRRGAPLQQDDYGHEVVAYLNRLGQLYYFFNGSLGRSCGIEVGADVPAIVKLLPLRNKHAAHRSIDMPRGDDDAMLAEMHMIGMSGGLRHPRPDSQAPALKPGSPYEDVEFTLRESLPTYQIQNKLDGASFVTFCPELEHAQILAEAYAAFATIVDHVSGDFSQRLPILTGRPIC